MNIFRKNDILNRIAKKGNVLWYVQPPLKRSRKMRRLSKNYKISTKGFKSSPLLLNFHCNSRVFPNESFCCSDKRREINNYFNQYSCLSVLSALTLCTFLVVQMPSSEMSLKRSYFPLTSGEKKTTAQLYHEWKIKIAILGSYLIKFIIYFGFIY
ncbi:hypothetical protein Avbf_06082, partial [Armadillidium vulgare]